MSRTPISGGNPTGDENRDGACTKALRLEERQGLDFFDATTLTPGEAVVPYCVARPRRADRRGGQVAGERCPAAVTTYTTAIVEPELGRALDAALRSGEIKLPAGVLSAGVVGK